jgi:four helix bundle protein
MNTRWRMANGEWGGMLSGTINSYRDLRVWQDSMALAEACYRLTRGFPKDEMFGLTSQIRRSATSIPANIAEGHGRENTRSFIQFLRIAQGSVKELETHLLIAQRTGISPSGCQSSDAKMRKSWKNAPRSHPVVTKQKHRVNCKFPADFLAVQTAIFHSLFAIRYSPFATRRSPLAGAS